VSAAPAEPGSSPRGGGRLVGLLEHQVSRFAVIGVVNTLFAFGVFAAMNATLGVWFHYLVALVAAHVVSILEAYVMQRLFVFRVRGRWWRELARFSSVYAVALAVNLVALPFLVEVVHLPVLPAQGIVMLATACGTFVVHRSFTFRRKASRTVVPGPATRAGASAAD
jgi:putative flippase GtrA